MTTDPAPVTDPNALLQHCKHEAVRYLAKFESKQRFVENIETVAAAAHPDVSVARHYLKQDADYNSHCGARDAYLRAAEMYATMVLALKA